MSLLIRASAKPSFTPNKIEKKTLSSVKAPPTQTGRALNDYLSVAERVNGRAAMIGFTSAVIDEIMTGNSIIPKVPR